MEREVRNWNCPGTVGVPIPEGVQGIAVSGTQISTGGLDELGDLFHPQAFCNSVVLCDYAENALNVPGSLGLLTWTKLPSWTGATFPPVAFIKPPTALQIFCLLQGSIFHRANPSQEPEGLRHWGCHS